MKKYSIYHTTDPIEILSRARPEPVEGYPRAHLIFSNYPESEYCKKLLGKIRILSDELIKIARRYPSTSSGRAQE